MVWFPGCVMYLPVCVRDFGLYRVLFVFVLSEERGVSRYMQVLCHARYIIAKFILLRADVAAACHMPTVSFF